MRISTLWKLLATILGIAHCAAAQGVAQESFAATHVARLDIVSPFPNAGTIGSAAIIAVNPLTSSAQVRITSLDPGNGVDSAFVVYSTGPGFRLVVAGLPFPQGSATLSAEIPLFTQQMLLAIDSGHVFIEVHSAGNHAVYTSGPVVAAPTAITPEPEGAQVVPPVSTTNAVGNCSLVFDPGANAIRYNAWWLDLDGKATWARIRQGAPGTNGATVLDMPLVDNATQAIGTWDAPSQDAIAALAAGGLYFEVGSSAHPNGELRGQIYPVETYTSALDSRNESPAVTGSSAGGTAFLMITAHGTVEAFNKLQGVMGNLSGPITAAHIHLGAKGANGAPAATLETQVPNVLDLELATGSAGGTLSNATVQEIRAERSYVNVHTSAHQSGEARGQLIAARTNLHPPTGAVEVPSETAGTVSARYLAAERLVAFTLGSAPRERRIVLHALDGRQVRAITTFGAEATMPAGDLPAGVYLAQVLENGRTAGTCRVLIMP